MGFMKRNISVLAVTVVVLFTASCTANKKIPASGVSVNHLSDTSKLRGGSLLYSLPRTILTVRAEMERKVSMPGPYAAYAEDMLGLSDVVLKEKEQWRLTGITVESHEEADPSEYYLVETLSSFGTNLITLRNEGLIMDINPGAGTKSISLLPGTLSESPGFRTYDLGSDEYFLSRADTAYRRVSMNDTYIRVPYLVEKKKKLSTEQLAERTARRIMELRDGRILILTGEANVFPQSDAAINEINRLEKEYLELFTGKDYTEKRVLTFQVIPDRESPRPTFPLFSFAEDSGPCAGAEDCGTKVEMLLAPEQKTKDLTILSNNTSETPGQKAERLFYRIPDVVKISIMMGEKPVFISRKLVYQYGEIMQLPSNYMLSK